MLPVCQGHGMGVLTWSPLASGFLSGKFRKGLAVDLSTGRAALTPARIDPSIPETAAKYELVEQLLEVAAGIGCSLPELAVAFPVAHPDPNGAWQSPVLVDSALRRRPLADRSAA